MLCELEKCYYIIGWLSGIWKTAESIFHIETFIMEYCRRAHGRNITDYGCTKSFRIRKYLESVFRVGTGVGWESENKAMLIKINGQQKITNILRLGPDVGWVPLR